MPERWTIAGRPAAPESEAETSGVFSCDMVIKAMRTLSIPTYRPETYWMSPVEYEQQYGPHRTIPSQRRAGHA